MLPQINTKIDRSEEPIFTPDFNQIHFNNGYIDLETLDFKQRIKGKNYVNLYIKRDYQESSKYQHEKLYKIIKKIYPNKEDLESILLVLGSAITGKATKMQKLLFLLGKGSSGKSTIMKLTQKAIECYLETLEEDAFSGSNNNKDKTFSTFHNRPAVRVIWTNEPKEDKMDPSIFKQFCEGKMRGKLLYENGIHDFEHNGLPIFTSNSMPNINMDSGIERRILCYNHTAEFTSDITKVNETNNVYHLDLDVIENIESEGLLNTWIDILSKYANKWIKKQVIEFSENFKETTKDVINSNDIYQDFIDSKLTITNDENDKIGKKDMLNLYKEMHPKSKIEDKALITKLSYKGLIYKKDLRLKSTNLRGCYIGVIKRENYTATSLFQNENNTITDNNNDDHNDEIQLLKKENEELKSK
eukprot:gene17232-23756_t